MPSSPFTGSVVKVPMTLKYASSGIGAWTRAYVTDPVAAPLVNAGRPVQFVTESGRFLDTYVVDSEDGYFVANVVLPSGEDEVSGHFHVGPEGATQPPLRMFGGSLTPAASPETISFTARHQASGGQTTPNNDSLVDPSVEAILSTDDQWLRDLVDPENGIGGWLRIDTSYPGNQVPYENPVSFRRAYHEGSWTLFGRNPLLDTPGGSDFNSDTYVCKWGEPGSQKIRVIVRQSTGSVTGMVIKYFDASSAADFENPNWQNITFGGSAARGTDCKSPSLTWSPSEGWHYYEQSESGNNAGSWRVRADLGTDGTNFSTSPVTIIEAGPIGGRSQAFWHGEFRYHAALGRLTLITGEQVQAASNTGAVTVKQGARIFECVTFNGNEMVPCLDPINGTWVASRRLCIDLQDSPPAHSANGVYQPTFAVGDDDEILVLYSSATSDTSKYVVSEISTDVDGLLGWSDVADTEADVRAFFNAGIDATTTPDADDPLSAPSILALFDFVNRDDGTTADATGTVKLTAVDQSGGSDLPTFTEGEGWSFPAVGSSLEIDRVGGGALKFSDVLNDATSGWESPNNGYMLKAWFEVPASLAGSKGMIVVGDCGTLANQIAGYIGIGNGQNTFASTNQLAGGCRTKTPTVIIWAGEQGGVDRRGSTIQATHLMARRRDYGGGSYAWFQQTYIENEETAGSQVSHANLANAIYDGSQGATIGAPRTITHPNVEAQPGMVVKAVMVIGVNNSFDGHVWDWKQTGEATTEVFGVGGGLMARRRSRSRSR